MPPKKKPTTLTVPEARQLLPLDFSDLDLNPREMKFLAVYCTNGFKGPEAAKEAGYQGANNSLKSTAIDLLKRPVVVEALKRFIDTSITQYKNKLEYEILDTYYKRAMYDISIFYYEDGTIKPLDEIEKDWLCVIDGIEKRYYGSGATISVTSYQLPNRDNSLQMLYKLMNGVDPNAKKDEAMPVDVRAKLKQIFQGTSPVISESPLRTTTKITLEQTSQPMAKRGPGRPKNPPTINVTPKKPRGRPKKQAKPLPTK